MKVKVLAVDVFSRGWYESLLPTRNIWFITEVLCEQCDICSIICRTGSFSHTSWEDHKRLTVYIVAWFVNFGNVWDHWTRMAGVTKFKEVYLYAGQDSPSVLSTENMCTLHCNWHPYINTNGIETKTNFSLKKSDLRLRGYVTELDT